MSERLRELAEKATPGPWQGTTIGTRSQRAAAKQAYASVMARRDKERPDIEFTDMSWVRTEGDDWLNVALIGNGRNGPENAAYIAAASPDVVLRLLRIEEAARTMLAAADPVCCDCGVVGKHGPDDADCLTIPLRDALQEDSHVGK